MGIDNRKWDFLSQMVQADVMPPCKAVLFDLDGTLIDHFRIIYRCYLYALNKLSLEPVTFEKVRAAVGGAVQITFAKLIPEAKVEEAVRLFREEFDRIWHEDITILPGAEWLLDGLHSKGMRMAVFTNKEGERARRLLAHIGLDSRLDRIFGTLDTPWRKPQPEFTRHVLEQLQADPSHACMVGDSPYDVEAAAAVNMPCYTVATGSHTLAQLREETASAGVFPTLYDLGEQVFGLVRPKTENS